MNGGEQRRRGDSAGSEWAAAAAERTVDEVFGTPPEGTPRDWQRSQDPLDGFRDLLDPPRGNDARASRATPVPRADDIWGGSDRRAHTSPSDHSSPQVQTSAPGRASAAASLGHSRRQSAPWTLLALVGAAAAATVLLVLGR